MSLCAWTDLPLKAQGAIENKTRMVTYTAYSGDHRTISCVKIWRKVRLYSGFPVRH